MDGIKKKMIAMKLEKENALERAVQYEALLKKKEEEREKKEQDIAELNNKLKQAQTACDEIQESLQESLNKLEETDKRSTNAEAEVAAMTRRIRLLEEDLEVSSSRLTETLAKLEEASKTAEESERVWRGIENRLNTYDKNVEDLEKTAEEAIFAADEADRKYKEALITDVYWFIFFTRFALRIRVRNSERKNLETRSIADDERLSQLEDQQKEAKYIAEDADRKYDEAARKLAILEVDFERAESRLEAAERRIKELESELKKLTCLLKSHEIKQEQVDKIVELEEELRVVGNNMKALEISEQESAQREESYEETIRDLTERLKAAEQRAAEAERQVSKLQNEVDHLEGDVYRPILSPCSHGECCLVYPCSLHVPCTPPSFDYFHFEKAESRAAAAELDVNRRAQEIKRTKDRIITEHSAYEALRQEMNSMINEFHSI
ncbi:hypothetical protein EG68_09275 [Paragonimus skrjabini miyazakii]|uniref:Tropomyosin n=1 Tax=Paragonimus skrjabini miyazakii TaxID=59628 RepID=A0A8S9YXA6_9TREM|nr:hypothetical protein EG68_09275 [Paragonimus skrjabini miyazakii]